MYDESLIQPYWYCLRSKPRQEAIAAAALRQLGLEVFSPRIRFQRVRLNGMAWANEALFPGYLFVRFVYAKQHREIASIRGIIKIVTFGKDPINVGDQLISDLREHVSDNELIEITQEIRPGDEVRIMQGPFSGLQALVTRLLPSSERVAILLQLLGEEREVEVTTGSLFSTSQSRKTFLSNL